MFSVSNLMWTNVALLTSTQGDDILSLHIWIISNQNTPSSSAVDRESRPSTWGGGTVTGPRASSHGGSPGSRSVGTPLYSGWETSIFDIKDLLKWTTKVLVASGSR